MQKVVIARGNNLLKDRWVGGIEERFRARDPVRQERETERLEYICLSAERLLSLLLSLMPPLPPPLSSSVLPLFPLAS